ncbi:MAG: hypothetical protein FJX51_06655 [Alphaproteobacteria bacterium]|nr:hypothetical protein [Alphaproteobacteria bacterium]
MTTGGRSRTRPEAPASAALARAFPTVWLTPAAANDNARLRTPERRRFSLGAAITALGALLVVAMIWR